MAEPLRTGAGAEASPQVPEAFLVELHGLDPGRRVRLHGAPLLLGRSSKCDLRIDQATVSRTHARIRPDEGGWVIEDLGSTHGTWLDTIPIHRAVLGHADRIRLGHTVFRFVAEPPLEASLQQAIHRLVTRDGLTDLLNRSAFLEVLERELARARRYRRPLSLVRFEVRAPPELGEVEGDLLIETAARRAAREVRVEDVLARWEGAAFLALLPEVEGAGADAMAARLAERVARPLPWSPDASAVRVRVATAELTPETGSAADLVEAVTRRGA